MRLAVPYPYGPGHARMPAGKLRTIMKASPRCVAAIAAAGCLLAGGIVWIALHLSAGKPLPGLSTSERGGPDLQGHPGPAEALEPFDRARPWEGLTAENASGRLSALQQEAVFWEKVSPGFYRGWGTVDGPAAMAAAERELAQRRAPAIRMALLGWAAADEQAVRSWIEAQPAGPDRLNELRNLIRGHKPANPADFVSWVHGRFGEEDLDGTLVRSLAGVWAKEDPEAGAQWLATLPENTHLAGAADSLFGTWARVDAESSSRFLADMPEGTLRDSAISAFSRSIAPAEPEAALAWAQAIGDSELRERTTGLVEGMQPEQEAPELDAAAGLPEDEAADSAEFEIPEDTAGPDPESEIEGEDTPEPSGETDVEGTDFQTEPQDDSPS